MPSCVSWTVVATGIGANQNHESKPTSPSPTGFAATSPVSELQSGIGGGASGPAQATLSGVALSSLSSAMTCTQTLWPTFIPDCVTVRGSDVEAACKRLVEPPTVNHDE